MNKMWNSFYLLRKTLFLLVLLLPAPVFAQTASEEPDLGKVFHVGVFLFFLLVFLVLITLVAYHNREDNEMPTLAKAWFWLSSIMNKSTPVENESSVMLEHDYDGIKELDNVLPPWWKYLFYVTIVFSAIYMVNYHVANIWPLSDAEYREEIKQADLQRAILMGTGAFVNEKTVTILTDPASSAAGAEIFRKNCTSCHGQKGEGLVGPNLTDVYWINGGGIRNIFKTISAGVPEKGMISWKSQLKPKDIQQVASFIMSLSGTNPPNAKPPQGTVWVDTAADSTAAKKDSTIKI